MRYHGTGLKMSASYRKTPIVVVEDRLLCLCTTDADLSPPGWPAHPLWCP